MIMGCGACGWGMRRQTRVGLPLVASPFFQGLPAEFHSFPGAATLVGDVLPSGVLRLIFRAVCHVIFVLCSRLRAFRARFTFVSCKSSRNQKYRHPPGVFPRRVMCVVAVVFASCGPLFLFVKLEARAAPCAVLPPGTCFVGCRSRPDCSRGAGGRRRFFGVCANSSYRGTCASV